MCKPKPGPRCAAHTKKALDAVRVRIAALEKDLAESEKIFFNAPPLQTDRTPEQNDAAKKYYQLRVKIGDERRGLFKAEVAYYSTPAGQKESYKEIQDLRDQHQAKPIYRISEEIHRMEQAQKIALLVREKQVALYKNLFDKSDKVLGYKIDDNTSQKDMQIILDEVGRKNVFPGSVERDNIDRKEQILVQSRIEKLLSYFERASDNQLNTSSSICEVYEVLHLTPGFKLLGVGSYRAAYLDKASGKVIKIPLNLNPRANTRSREALDDQYETEQYSYALIDLSVLRDNNVDYAETQFYTSQKYGNLPVIVQPDLSDSRYEPIGDDDENSLREKLYKAEGIWDIHPGNALRDKETGKIILFDCLNNGSETSNSYWGVESEEDEYEDDYEIWGSEEDYDD